MQASVLASWFETPAPQAPHHEGEPSIAGIALLEPRIAAIVIAAYFPVARRVVFEKFNRLQPLCAFPEIKMRYHQPHRSAVLRRQRLAGPAVGEECVLAGK